MNLSIPFRSTNLPTIRKVFLDILSSARNASLGRLGRRRFHSSRSIDWGTNEILLGLMCWASRKSRAGWPHARKPSARGIRILRKNRWSDERPRALDEISSTRLEALPVTFCAMSQHRNVRGPKSPDTMTAGRNLISDQSNPMGNGTTSSWRVCAAACFVPTFVLMVNSRSMGKSLRANALLASSGIETNMRTIKDSCITSCLKMG